MNDRLSSATALVIGGGVIGLSSALALRAAGYAVTLVERGELAREASWAGGGILSPLYPWRAPVAVWRLAAESIALYPALCAELAADTGIDPEWTASGMQVLDQGECTAAAAWCARHRLTIEQAGPGFLLPWVAQLRNPRLCRALAAQATRRGVRLLTQQGRVRLLGEGDRAVALVAGETLRADLLVAAVGAWSAELLSVGGWSPAITPVRGQMLLLQAPPGALSQILLSGERYLIPRRDGRVLVGSTVEHSGFDCAITPEARSSLLAFAIQLAPQLSEARVAAQWAGLRPGTSDGVPLIQRHPEFQNLYINAGHHRNGLTLAPASAQQLLRVIAAG